jgi:hypothetical protein
LKSAFGGFTETFEKTSWPEVNDINPRETARFLWTIEKTLIPEKPPGSPSPLKRL